MRGGSCSNSLTRDARSRGSGRCRCGAVAVQTRSPATRAHSIRFEQKSSTGDQVGMVPTGVPTTLPDRNGEAGLVGMRRGYRSRFGGGVGGGAEDAEKRPSQTTASGLGPPRTSTRGTQPARAFAFWFTLRTLRPSAPSASKARAVSVPHIDRPDVEQTDKVGNADSNTPSIRFEWARAAGERV